MKLRRQLVVSGMALILSVGLLAHCGRWFKPSTPQLAVVIVVDQMRYDYLVRFAGLFSGGFAKLLHEGAVFTNAHHDHAGTETAPGHATLLTGAFPSHHGIIGNSWNNRHTGARVYCVDDSGFALIKSGEQEANALSREGRSPKNLLLHTLGDWLKAKYPQAKVISIAGKDRSAILMAGFDADAAYWFHSATGGFVSSRYYLDALPAWLAKWNAERHADRYDGKAWEKSHPETDYFVSREDLFDAENDGEHTTFPHQFEMDTTATNSMAPHAAGQHPIASQFYEWLRDTPFLDALTLDVARLAVQSEKLGADDTPDLLLIGLSATDLVGHTYGPLSQESEDNLLRLDAELAKFFDFLEATVGLKNCVLALSADHGVLPLPEELRRRGFEAARIPQAEALDEVKSVQGEMQQEWRTNRPILRTFLWNVNLDYTAAESLRLSPAEFRSRVAAKLRSLSFVNDVFTYDELNATNNKTREYLDQTRHSFHPERSPDLAMQIKPYYLVSISAHGTTHGSPYEYDSHVPLIFWGERVKPGRVDSLAKTIDLAPTLAHLLGLELSRLSFSHLQAKVEAGVDGRVLTTVIKN